MEENVLANGKVEEYMGAGGARSSSVYGRGLAMFSASTGQLLNLVCITVRVAVE